MEVGELFAINSNKKKVLIVFALTILVVGAFSKIVYAAGGEEVYQSNFYGTFWALLPPIIAIALALITKEVYLSLFLGIITGGLLYANFNPWVAINSVTEMYISKVGDAWNAGILIFLAVLGMMVALMNKAGGSSAYGTWASKRIKTKRGGLLSTFILGVVIFVDDYFNCLTVGSVMRPVTDKQKISRAKLSYIIDATAAPVCILAPISSWAAAVTSSATGDVDGFSLFLQSIPFNLYALLTLIMVVAISVMNFDYGPMRKYEKMAMEGDIYGGTGDEYSDTSEDDANTKGKVIDLVLPVLFLIAISIFCMVYTGGIFEGKSFIEAFADSDASMGLALGSLITLIFVFILYVPRKVMTFREFADCLPAGCRQMVPAILILSCAWALGGFCGEMLGAGDFVGTLVQNSSFGSSIMPAIFFVVAVGLAFATGTSWGTFAILIPIAQAVFPGEITTILVISISAILAGAVCGDHASPISDTTIMSSAGAQVNHIIHVSTQIPYAMLVAVISFLGFILAGWLQVWWIVLIICAVVLLVALFLLKKFQKPLADMKPAMGEEVASN